MGLLDYHINSRKISLTKYKLAHPNMCKPSTRPFLQTHSSLHHHFDRFDSKHLKLPSALLSSQRSQRMKHSDYQQVPLQLSYYSDSSWSFIVFHWSKNAPKPLHCVLKESFVLICEATHSRQCLVVCRDQTDSVSGCSQDE